MSPMSTKIIAAMSLLTMSLTAAAHGLAEASDEVQATAQSIVENPAIVSDDVQRSLDAILAHTKSPQWIEAQKVWRRDIQRLTGTRPTLDAEDQADALANGTEDRIIIFVSSSMPLTTLRNYARDLQRVNGLMVFRGMLGGMRTIAPTLKLIASILRIHPACQGQRCAMRKTALVIDPILFRQHAISRVPAAVFVEDMALAPYCERFDEQTVADNARHIVYGDVSVKSLAEELRRLSNSKRLDTMIRSLR